MKNLKILIILFLVIASRCLFALAQAEQRWQNLCQGGSSNPYCVAVGHDAYNNSSHPIALRGLKLGKITGVIWKKEGEFINNAGESPIIAPQNAYYYIVDNEISEPFLKLCSKVEVGQEDADEGFSQP